MNGLDAADAGGEHGRRVNVLVLLDPGDGRVGLQGAQVGGLDEVARVAAQIVVEEEAENGSVTGPKLMGLADDIAAGKITTPAAIAQAKATIEETRVAAR